MAERMGIREKLREKPAIAIAVGSVFVLAAIAIALRTYWPQSQADLSKAFYSDDDGKTWFVDSAYRVAPFDHNGKTAVVAHVYTYDNGSKKFCAYLAKFTPEGKSRLDAAMADAKKKGLSPDSVELYRDPRFMQTQVLVKRPGAGNAWLAYNDPKATTEVFTIHSPDGSTVDECFVY